MGPVSPMLDGGGPVVLHKRWTGEEIGRGDPSVAWLVVTKNVPYRKV